MNLKGWLKKFMGIDGFKEKDEILKQIDKFKVSKKYINMIQGNAYFNGYHDILQKKRMAIGTTGELEELSNLPNNKIIDNQYRKMVIQKSNYLVGKPITVQSDNSEYCVAVQKLINAKFKRVLKNICEDALNCGVGYAYVFYDEGGKLAFRRFKPYEIIPTYADEDRTILDKVTRFFTDDEDVLFVEVYEKDGVAVYKQEGSKMVAYKEFESYITIDGDGFTWGKVPIIPFKYNSLEIPLINMVKSLQDGLNQIISTFADNMQEDARNSILVLVNYDGENLGEFRRNLATYGAVKVSSFDGVNGDLKSLQIEVNAENYKAILELFKKAIIENAMGYDAKDDRLSGNANQLNIQSMYSDVDLDANSMEVEFQASFYELMDFINMYLGYDGDDDVTVIFNRDMLINEGDVIDNCIKSLGVLSNETIVSMHPWVTDVQAELDRLEDEKVEYSPFDKAEGDVVEE